MSVKTDRRKKKNMSIAKDIKPFYMSATLVKDEKLFKKLEKRADEEGLNDEETKYLAIYDDFGNANIEEFYYEEKDNEFTLSCNLTTTDGDLTFYISFELPDEVLIDLLATSVKRLNKLKTILEAVR
jgi:hypothetical protein